MILPFVVVLLLLNSFLGQWRWQYWSVPVVYYIIVAVGTTTTTTAAAAAVVPNPSSSNNHHHPHPYNNNNSRNGNQIMDQPPLPPPPLYYTFTRLTPPPPTRTTTSTTNRNNNELFPSNNHEHEHNHRRLPWLVLVHGLDSSSDTWKNNVISHILNNSDEMEKDNNKEEDATTYPSPTSSSTPSSSSLSSSYYSSSSCCWKDSISGILAMDCRGCGSSPDIRNNETDFSLSLLVQDVYDCIEHATLVENYYNYNNNCNDNDKDDSDNDKMNDEVPSTTSSKQQQQQQQQSQSLPKIILLGHSMGGRIAMSYAATYPEQIQTLIIEDMDIRRRPIINAPFTIHKTTTTQSLLFSRQFTTLSDAIQALSVAGYPNERIQTWYDQGRIYNFKKKNDKDKVSNNQNEIIMSTDLVDNQKLTGGKEKDEDDDEEDSSSSSYWWSTVNPDFRRLCYEHVVDTDYGVRDCYAIANYNNYNNNKPTTTTTVAETKKNVTTTESLRIPSPPSTTMTNHSFPIHVFVAGSNETICCEESLQQMETILGGSGSGGSSGGIPQQQKQQQQYFTIHRFPNATHSIHSSDTKQFMKVLQSIIVSFASN